MTHPFTPPGFQVSAFHCPHCLAFAEQHWHDLQIYSAGSLSDIGRADIAICNHCRDFSLWVDSRMVFPDSSQAPPPNPDLTDEIKGDYEEARSIINRSPRGAAALLRLCIQKLCIDLGGKGKDLNADIGLLVKKGLNPAIQRSLDVVRVIGNEAVHPGVIDLKDDPEIAAQLCGLINVIATTLITQPKEIDRLYEMLPQAKRDSIESRDTKI